MIKRFATDSFIRFVFFGILVTVSYFDVWNMYFLQDEWGAFGKILYAYRYGWETLLRVSGFHFIPLTSLANLSLFTLFGLNYTGYAWTGIVLHSLNAFLLSDLIGRITKHAATGMLTGILFATLNTPEQAVTSASVSPSLLPAGTLILLSITCFYNYLLKTNRRSLYASSALLFVALLFKEDAIFLFAFYSVTAYAFRRKEVRLVTGVLGVPFLLYWLLRFLFQYYSPHSAYEGSPLTVDLVFQSAHSYVRLIPTAIASSFVSSEWIMKLTRSILSYLNGYHALLIDLRFIFPFVRTITERQVFVFLSGGITALIIGIGAYWFRRAAKISSDRGLLALLFTYLIISYLPYSILPAHLSMESRHYYVPAFGAAALMAILYASLYRTTHSAIYRTVIVLVIVTQIAANIYQTQRIMREVYQPRSNLVKSVFAQIRATYPNVSKRAVFVSLGDRIPLQFGVGYMFMFALNDQHHYETLIKQAKLWNGPGYAKDGPVALGYFDSFDDFLGLYESEQLNPDEVYAFDYDSKTQQVTDVSMSLRQQLPPRY